MHFSVTSLLASLLLSGPAHAFEPPIYAPPLYTPPIRMAHVTGAITKGSETVCNIDIAVPVYERFDSAGKVTFKTPAYVRCAAATKKHKLAISASMTVSVGPSGIKDDEGKDLKWFEGDVFVMDGTMEGERLGFMDAGVGTYNSNEKSLLLFTQRSVDGELMTFRLRMDDNELR